jgi:kynurenine formamidase
MDAPLHFAAGDGTIDRIPLEHCLVPAWVVDLSAIAPKELISVQHLGAVADELRPGEGLLLKTGWSQYVDQPQYYRDNFPRISEELANWCAERRVRMLVNSLEEVTLIHRILLSHNIIIVEGLTNLGALRAGRVLFGALPLKIDGGDGSPCRAFAIEGDLDKESFLTPLRA